MAFGHTAIAARARLAASGRARPLSAPGAYEIWELSDPRPRANLVAADGTEQRCEIEVYRPVAVSVVCRSAVPGRLVLGDVFAPGWRACVNGSPARIEAFDGVFRSVSVPAGESRTEFGYQPVPFLRTLSCPAE